MKDNMGLGEYFFGTETREFMKNNNEKDRELVFSLGEDTESCPFSEKSGRRYIFSELMVGKYMPNVTSSGSLIAAAVTGEPNWLWGVVAGEALRISYGHQVLSLHKKHYRE
jgi:hypothetical protein